MSPETILPLVIFALVSSVTPGGATTMATASGAHFGFRRSIPLMVGIAAGLASMAAAAAGGLAGVLAALPSLQLALKTAGSAYLLWLAWKVGSAGAPRLDAELARPTSFVGGVWLLWFNPKAWAMTLGAAASFATLASGPAQLSALLALAFGFAASVSVSLWCTAGTVMARLIRTEAQWRGLNMVLGVLLALSIVPMWL
ncbi:MAG TPA: LysE family translocator [Mesorhizobium sp.]|jgi:threonine/homoserine/homoserine lactone efflux protein|uniref:LysE family translocator n=1 Tax=Mesorhizobium sp. TaxID=1871066 RepID=UPI002DDD1484|nr:LysE family translocator [Mesorhizobium sp.]HEV2504990.1 LysE family translocator [Mesorhizobium sp.]